MAPVIPSILIYANCQGEELRNIGRYLPCMSGRLNFKWIPLHLVAEDDWNTQYGDDFMNDVVTVWEQVETGVTTPNRAALRERVHKDCPVVKFPPLSATCLWPFSGNDPRISADPERYPWPDSIAAVLATESLPDDALFDKYMRISNERMPDLSRRFRLDVTRWKASDAIADVQAADWVEQHFRDINLFYTSGHIAAPAVTYLMTQLLGRTQILSRGLLNAALQETDLLQRHHTGQDFECVPIHPRVAEQFDLRFYDPNATYRWHRHEWTFRQYILRYIRWAEYLR